jgi:uncharacterized protein
VRGLGTLVNLVTVACGSAVGVAIGARLSERMRTTIMRGLGLVVIAVAVVGFEPLADPTRGLRRSVVMIVGVIAGGVIGEALRLEERLAGAGAWLEARLGSEGPAPDEGRFVDGFVVASTVFCVGPLTVVGAIQDGLGADVRLLAIKSALDGIASIGFASVYGWGVAASLVTVAVVQGSLTLGAAFVGPLLTPEVLAELGAVGSLLVLGIGLRLLDAADVPVLALLPAILVAPLLAGVADALL